MRTRSILSKPLNTDINHPHFAVVKYWDYFYLNDYRENQHAFLESCKLHVDYIFENRNSNPGYSVGNTHACVILEGEWYWEDVLAKYVKEFKKFEKYIVCLGFNDNDFDYGWKWYSEDCQYPFVTYSQEETQGWSAWYVEHLNKEYPGAKDFLFSVFKKYFDPDERLEFIRKKIKGELEWSFGLVDTSFEHMQAEWLRDSHKNIPL